METTEGKSVCINIKQKMEGGCQYYIRPWWINIVKFSKRFPPSGPNFKIFNKFLAKFDQMLCWHRFPFDDPNSGKSWIRCYIKSCIRSLIRKNNNIDSRFRSKVYDISPHSMSPCRKSTPFWLICNGCLWEKNLVVLWTENCYWTFKKILIDNHSKTICRQVGSEWPENFTSFVETFRDVWIPVIFETASIIQAQGFIYTKSSTVNSLGRWNVTTDQCYCHCGKIEQTTNS